MYLASRLSVTMSSTTAKEVTGKSLKSPWLLKGEVIKGFGRGSKELGIPTANLDHKCLIWAMGMR